MSQPPRPPLEGPTTPTRRGPSRTAVPAELTRASRLAVVAAASGGDDGPPDLPPDDAPGALPPALPVDGGAGLAGVSPGLSEVTSVFGSDVPFAGRRHEVEQVYNVLRASLNQRQLRVVWLHGPPGMGKTRLVMELHRLVGPAQRSLHWVRVSGQDSSAPPSLAGRVLAGLLGGAAMVRQPDAAKAALAELAHWIGAERAPEALQVVGPLVGLRNPWAADDHLPVEPPARVAAQLTASLLRARARLQPVILQIDATVVAAEQLQQLLTALHEQVREAAIAVVIEAVVPPDAAVQATVVALEPLSESVATVLARKLLQHVSGAPVDLAQRLAKQAAGSPERLLDILRGMQAAGDIVRLRDGWQWRRKSELGVSSSWQKAKVPAASGAVGGLPDRIARLPDDLRQVTEAAAIFGSTCWMGGVLSVLRGVRGLHGTILSRDDRGQLKRALDQLQSLDILVAVEAVGDTRREQEFAFVHPADPQWVVSALDDSRRQVLSRLAAQWLATRPRVDAIAEPARLAQLFEAGARPRQSAQCYLDAGNAARSVGQLQRALSLYAAGARLVDADDADLACDLRTAEGGGLLRVSRHAEAEKVLLQALHMALCLDDDLRCGIVQLRLAQVARLSGRYDIASAYLERAMAPLKATGAHRWIADLSDELGQIHLIRGDVDAYKSALQHFLKALALRRRGQDRRVVARSLCNIARVHLGRAHLDDALDAVQEAVQICDQVQERWGGAQARAVLGEVHAAQGLHAEAFAAWDQAIQIATEVGDRYRRLEVLLARAEVSIVLGEWPDAAALMVDAAELARQLEDPELLSGYYRIQASIALERNALETADLDSERAVEVARPSGARLAMARALVVRACVLGTRALSGRGAQATVTDRLCTAAFDEGLQVLREVGDLVRLSAGLRSYTAYLSQRGGGPRLAAVQQKLAAVEAELAQVAGA